MSIVLVAGIPDDAVGALRERLPRTSFVRVGTSAELRRALADRDWSMVVLGRHTVDAERLEAVREACHNRPSGGVTPVLVVDGGAAGAGGDGVRMVAPERLVDEVAAELDPARAPALSVREPSAAESRRTQAAAAMQMLWERHRGTILQRIDTVESAAAALLEGRLDPELRDTASREAHKLAGSLGTFGYAEGTRLARGMEQLLLGDAPLAPAQALPLAEDLLALRREIARAPAAASEPEVRSAATAAPDQGAAGPKLLIVEPDEEFAGRLAAEATRRGLRPTVLRSADAAVRLMEDHSPDVVVVDLSDGSQEAGRRLLMALRARHPAVAAVALTGGDGVLERNEIVRLGVRRYLRKPVRAPRVIDQAQDALRAEDAAQGHILAVDDDPVMLDLLRSQLAPHGLRVSTVSDPLRFWDALADVEPDMVLLDIDLPHLDGLELCRVLRGDPRWATLPVLFLTARADPSTTREVYAAGADDYLTKPISGPELAGRVINRLERTRLYRGMADVDATTGVESRRHAEERLARYIRLADRHGQPLSVAVVEVQGGGGVEEPSATSLRQLGAAMQDTYREDDVVARWSENRFVVGMYGGFREELASRMSALLERTRGSQLDLEVRIGLAEFPRDGRDMQSLYAAALDALRVPAPDAPDATVAETGSERVDVVVVDDDEAVAGLLVHTLETAGHSVHWLRDGPSAVEALSGAVPRLRARVVLLDVGLPGMDGISVLRTLAQEGVTQSSHVIMLTLRSAEREVLQTLELGAYDHIAKPFSVPVLMQKLRRALS